MDEDDIKQIEDIIEVAKILQEKVNSFCSETICECCPLDKIEDCNNYMQIAEMKYNKELDQFD